MDADNKSNKRRKRTMVSVGTFDGLHLGHMTLLCDLSNQAAARGLEPLVVTFDRHPLETIAPDRAPGLIMDPRERDVVLKALVDNLVVVPFDESVRNLTVSEWMRRLRDDYGARAVMMGYDNSFGCDGRGMSPEEYRAKGAELGLEVLMARELPGYSSTEVRRALAAGDIEKAADVLGRAFPVKGTVVRGRGLGRTIGVPTANIAVSPRQLLPKPGVYAATVCDDFNDFDECKAVVNIGVCPTVTDGGVTTVEAHLLGFRGDLYGRTLRLYFAKRLRDERKFGGIDELTSQIAKDIEEADAVLEECGRDDCE